MDKLYELFYSGGIVDLSKKNNYSTPTRLSRSQSQPQLSMDYTRQIYPNDELSYYTNKKIEFLTNKLIQLENDKYYRQNEMIQILIDKLNEKYKNNNKGNNDIQQVILPPIPIIQQIPLNHSYSTINMIPYEFESNNIVIRDKYSDYLNRLNSKIYYDNYNAMNKINNLENDYRNVSQILENKIDQINQQYQLNFDLLLKAIEKKHLNSSFNQTKSNNSKNSLNNNNVRKMIQDEIRKNLEMKRQKELEKLRSERNKKVQNNQNSNNSTQIIEKIFPVVLDQDEVQNYILETKTNKKNPIFTNEKEIKSNKKKTIKYKLLNTKSQISVHKSRKMNKIRDSKNSEIYDPKAKFLIRSMIENKDNNN